MHFCIVLLLFGVLPGLGLAGTMLVEKRRRAALVVGICTVIGLSPGGCLAYEMWRELAGPGYHGDAGSWFFVGSLMVAVGGLVGMLIGWLVARFAE